MRSHYLHTMDILIGELVQNEDAPGDLESTLQQIAQAAQQLFAADLCTIFAINPLTQRFFFPTTIAGTLRHQHAATLRQPRPDGFAYQVIEREMVLVEHLERHSDSQSSFTAQEEIISFAAIALRTQRHAKPLAVLYIDYRQPQRFRSRERTLLRLFARQASAILQTTWFLRRYGEVVRIGHDINRGIESAKMLFEHLQTHLAGILDMHSFFMLSVYQPQTDRRDLYMVEEGRYQERQNGALVGISRWVIQHGQKVIIRHLSEETQRLPVPLAAISQTKMDQESLIFIPLMLREIPLGVLSLQHPLPHAYDDEDIRLLELLSNHVALALSNIHLYKSLRRLNETGQFLTQQLDSAQVLQGVVEQIRAVTKADVVVLYPYQAATSLFELPPQIDGRLLAQSFPLQSFVRPDDIAALLIDQISPLFAQDSATLYAELAHTTDTRKGDFEQREQIHSTAAVPLRVGMEPVGVLFVNFRNPQHFDTAQKLLIEGLASYAAIGIKNARAFTSLLHQRLDELELLQRIQRTIGRTLNLDAVLQSILELAMERVRADAASILLYNQRTASLETWAALGENAEHSRKQIIALAHERGLTRAAFVQQLPIRVANVRTDPRWRDAYVEAAPDMRAELDVPLLSDNEALGVINLESRSIGAFTQADQDFMITLATQVVLAIKNAQAYERERRAVDELEATQKIGREIVRQLNLVEVMQTILSHALTITRSSTGHIMLYDPQRDDLYNIAERGLLPNTTSARLPRGKGVIGQAIERKTLLNVNVCAPPWQEVYQRFIPDVCWELAVPLLDNGVARGAINIESPLENPFTPRDERLLTALANLAVIALQNAERYQAAEARKQRLEALHEIDLTIINQLDSPDHVMKTVVLNALRLTNAEIADMDLYGNNAIITRYSTTIDKHDQSNPPQHTIVTVWDRLPQGIMAYVARTCRPYRTLVDAQADPQYVGDTNVHSEVAVPLLSETGTLVGVLNVESWREYAFDDEDLTILDLFAGQAVIAIKNARMYARAEQELQRFRLLHQAGRELGEIADLREIDRAYEIVTRVAYAAGQSQVIIRRYDSEKQQLRVVRSIEGHPIPPVPIVGRHEGLNGHVARERRTLVVPDVSILPPGMQVLLSTPLERSLVVTPIQFRDEYYGNLVLIHQDANHFLDVDVELFEGLATQLGLTIHRLVTARARQESEQRIKEAETMSSIGQAGVELAHRLGNDLGLVRSLVNQIKRELPSMGVQNQLVINKLDQITHDVGKVLSLSRDLKRDLASLREDLVDSDEAVDIDIRELLSEAVSAAHPLPTGTQLLLDLVEEGGAIHGIAKQILDILRNLLGNAIEAMPYGGTIVVRARTGDHDIKIQIEDTGTGIAPNHLPQIFALFYSTKGSSGFGLWSARRNALANGGDLQVISNLGRGTTFTLSLPKGSEQRQSS